MHLTTFSAAMLLLFAACSSSSTDNSTIAKPGPAMQTKPSAPVAIEATDVTTSSAMLTLTFQQPATGVTLKVYGVDGLVVQGVPKIGATFIAGEVATVPVTFVPGEGRSYLAAMVTGTFAGREDAKAVSFAIGEPNEAQRAAADADVVLDAEGRKIRVQPAKRK